MSDERQETVADIVAEMRKDIAEGTVGIWSDFGGEIARSYADRIEAAAKRESEAGAEAAARRLANNNGISLESVDYTEYDAKAVRVDGEEFIDQRLNAAIVMKA